MSDITVSPPLVEPDHRAASAKPVDGASAPRSWQNWVAKTAQLKVPDSKIQFLYDAAVRTMLLLSAEEAIRGLILTNDSGSGMPA